MISSAFHYVIIHNSGKHLVLVFFFPSSSDNCPCPSLPSSDDLFLHLGLRSVPGGAVCSCSVICYAMSPADGPFWEPPPPPPSSSLLKTYVPHSNYFHNYVFLYLFLFIYFCKLIAVSHNNPQVDFSLHSSTPLQVER